MMITSRQQIKDCTTAAYDYLRSRSDKNSVALQKQLQSLSLVSNVEVFEPTSLESVELYMCLEKLLTHAETKSTMVGKVLTLLTHISESHTIREALRDNVKIVPVLSNFLVESKLSKENHLKTLNLLSMTSYKIKIAYLEGWIMELVPFLAATVTKGIAGEESLLAAIQILANLCRSSSDVVEYLRRIPNNKMLLTSLSGMKNATLYVRLLVLEVMFLVHPELSEEIFSNSKTVDMIFTVAIEGFKEKRVAWLQLAADVFEELALVTSFEPVLREYQNYDTYLQLLLNYMTHDIPELLAEALLNFMCCLVKFNHQDTKSLHEDIFVNVTRWIKCQGCGEIAMQVVRELLAKAAASTLTEASRDTFVEAIKMSLTSSEDSDMTPPELQRIIIILGSVDTICASNEVLQLKLALKLEPSLFSNLLKRTLLLDSHCLNDGQDDVTHSERSSTVSSGYESTTCSNHGIASCVAEELSSKWDLQMTLKKTVSKAVILVLAVMKGLGAIKSEHLAEYRKVMGLPVVMSHLMWGGQSGLTEYVTRAWTIISDGSLSKECLEALVAATEENPSRTDSVSWSPTRMLGLHSHSAASTLPLDFEEKVDTLIARLGGTVQKMEIKDCALTDLMNLYEYKLASSAHSEESLQKALLKADIQNKQTSLQLMKANIQNDHLRGLLAKWESDMQKVRGEKAELQTTIKEVVESSRQFKSNFINEKEMLERKVGDLKKELAGIEGSLRDAEEKSAKLQHQLSSKVEELKKQQNIIHKEQQKGSELSKQVQKLEEAIKQSTTSLETLKKEMEILESIKLQLKKENGDLETRVKNKEEALAAKEEELEDARIKMNQMMEIQNMIYNISSRRVLE